MGSRKMKTTQCRKGLLLREVFCFTMGNFEHNYVGKKGILGTDWLEKTEEKG